MKIIGIDPSINNIGISWLNTETEEIKWHEINPPKDSGNYGSRRRMVGRFLCNNLTILNLTDANVGIIEYPNFQVSQRGKIAAEQGFTLDLAYLSGVVATFMPKTRWLMPTPIQWKGTQPKHAIGVKFGVWTGEDHTQVSDHCFEAAMMIKWYLDQEINPAPPIIR
jgi:hypothetical protein